MELSVMPLASVSASPAMRAAAAASAGLCPSSELVATPSASRSKTAAFSALGPALAVASAPCAHAKGIEDPALILSAEKAGAVAYSRLWRLRPVAKMSTLRFQEGADSTITCPVATMLATKKNR
jgi:hypothetical protein